MSLIALANAARVAAEAIRALSDLVARQEAERARATAVDDRALADAIRRGQMPETLRALKKRQK